MEKTKYQTLDQREHILKRPTMYIGNTEVSHHKLFFFTQERKNQMERKGVNMAYACWHLINEILQNARDHAIVDPTCNNIQVDTLPDGSISVFNNGNGIDVSYDETQQKYIPEIVFGVFMSSSNYDQENQKEELNIVGGQNGLGCKLTNVFSQRFKVETVFKNSQSNQSTYFSVEFSENMKSRSQPIIKPTDTRPFTRVTFLLDFARFKMKPEDFPFELLRKNLVDIAFTLQPIKRIAISFNGALLPSLEIREYLQLYSPSQDIFQLINPKYQIAMALNLEEEPGSQIGFVNSLEVQDGGDHIKSFVKSVALVCLNEKEIKKFCDSDAKKKKWKKNIQQLIEQKTWIVMNSIIPKVRFDSQTKQRLAVNKQVLQIDLDEAKLRDSPVYKVLVQKIIELQKSSVLSTTKKLDKKNLFAIEKLDDAHYAGTSKSSDCILILTEGDSAKSFSRSGLKALPENMQKFIGLYTLNGKPINIKNQTQSRIGQNQRLEELKKILGLQLKEPKYQNMRYGKIVIMSDQDVDGFHIKGLIINIFHSYWKELLQDQVYIYSYKTPVVKLFKNKKVIKEFFNFSQYLEWVQTNNQSNFTVKYYKGLATSGPLEAQESFKNFHNNIFSYRITSEEDDKIINEAFLSEQAEQRKQHILSFSQGHKEKEFSIDYETIRNASCTEYVKKELLQFWMEDNMRSIPWLYDGLKDSQRKILTVTLHKLKHEEKLVSFGGQVIKLSQYHHGDASMYQTIIGMAQNFQNTNNINYIKGVGQFGNVVGDKSGQPRYIFVDQEEIIKNIYPPKFFPVLDYDITETEKQIVPKFLFPIIPMILVNGCVGIGTGFSSQCPKFHPLELLETIRDQLRNPDKPIANLLPFFRFHNRNFTETKPNYWKHLPDYKVDYNKNSITLFQLPLNYTYKKYKENVLIDLRQNGTVKDVSSPASNELFFEKLVITFSKDHDLEDMNPSQIHQILKLPQNVSFSNTHLFIDQEQQSTNLNYPIKFSSLSSIIEKYLEKGIQVYSKYQHHYLANLQKTTEILQFKLLYIQAILDDKIVFKNHTSAQISEALALLSIPDKTHYNEAIHKTLIDGTKTSDLTQEKLDSLLAQVNQNQKLFHEQQNKSAQQLWAEDLDQLEPQLVSFFKNH